MVTIDDIWILKISQVILFHFTHFGFHLFSSRSKKMLSITLSTSHHHSIFSFSSYSLQAHKSSILHLPSSISPSSACSMTTMLLFKFPHSLLSFPACHWFYFMPCHHIISTLLYSTLLILLLTIVSADSLARSATAQGSPLCGT